MTASCDGTVLRSAATILERRSRRPKSFLLHVLVRFLRSVADDIDAESVDDLVGARARLTEAQERLAEAQHAYALVVRL